MTRKSLILALVGAGLVLATTSAAFSLYTQSWLARDTPAASTPTNSAPRTPLPATEASPGQPGLRWRTLAPDAQFRVEMQGGLLVETVAGGAAGAGRMPGINGQPLDTLDQLRPVIKQKPKDVALLILPDGPCLLVPLELG